MPHPVTDGKASICGHFLAFDTPETAHDPWARERANGTNRTGVWGGQDHPRLGPSIMPLAGDGVIYLLLGDADRTGGKRVKSPSPPSSSCGPGRVGTGLAGMPHHLSDIAHIWPFDDAATASRPLHLVEIFPSYYFALRIRARQWGPWSARKHQSGRPILGLIRFADGERPIMMKQTLVSAAALRWFAGQPDIGLCLPMRRLALDIWQPHTELWVGCFISGLGSRLVC